MAFKLLDLPNLALYWMESVTIVLLLEYRAAEIYQWIFPRKQLKSIPQSYHAKATGWMSETSGGAKLVSCADC